MKLESKITNNMLKVNFTELFIDYIRCAPFLEAKDMS